MDIDQPKTIRLINKARHVQKGVACVSLAHNEAHHIPIFLNHHRSLGVTHFLILDDSSTDGTRKLLLDEPDVSLYEPFNSMYRTHRGIWRMELASEAQKMVHQWLLLPDMDELFVYPNVERTNINSFVKFLEIEGSEAVFCPMIDMYDDAVIGNSRQQSDGDLIRYRFFDGTGYRLVLRKQRNRRRNPTPPLQMYGGMRERLYYRNRLEFINWLFSRVEPMLASIHLAMELSLRQRLLNIIYRSLSQRLYVRERLIQSKICMIKWNRSVRLDGAPHAISPAMKLSRVWGALLHLKGSDLQAEAQYKSERGQHAQNSLHYKMILENYRHELNSVMYSGTVEYAGSESLLNVGLMRSSREWDHCADTRP